MTKSESLSSELEFTADLFKAADKLRGNLEPSEYKHVALGLIFLKYISDAFDVLHTKLTDDEHADEEDPEEYLAENVFWVPQEARWMYLRDNAKLPDIQLADGKKVNIGGLIDRAMESIENVPTNEALKGVLPKNYARPTLNKIMLGELIDLFSNIGLHDGTDRARDLLGLVYEYFLSSFASSEGKRGGEFFTPRSVVGTLVAMLEPYEGRVYDPCCGSGGMFVQSEKFIDDHGGRRDAISVYGQEINHTTWRLAKMNLAMQGIDADIRWNNDGSLHRDELPDLRADFILANPPFNISDWGGDRLRDDVRWKFGIPPVSNANFAWLQHIHHHLAPHGSAGVVLANGSMSSQQSGEGEIRKAMIEEDAIDAMIALPGQLFYSTQIPACLWILSRDKSANGHRDRRGEILFIDARNLGFLVDRVRREFNIEDIDEITGAYHRWRDDNHEEAYEDVLGFCKSVSLEEVKSQNYILTPGRFVGSPAAEEDSTPFNERVIALREKLFLQFELSNTLDEKIRSVLSEIAE